MKMKSIAWSYPTSPNADRFGFRAGCWTVRTVEGEGTPAVQPPVAIRGFRTKEEAKDYANTMPELWSRWTA